MITASDGVKLHVCSVGNGKPFVFVHEFSGDVRSWDPQVGFFSRYFRCTTYCARGYPPSDVPPRADAYSQARAADDLADVVRSVTDEPAHILGLSMGGFAALHFALKYPQLTRSLVMAGVGYGAKPEQQPAYGEAMRREADHAIAVGMATVAREMATSSYAQYLRAKDPVGWHRFAAQLAEHSAIGMAMTLRGILAARPSLWHLADAIKTLAKPALLLIGDEDAPCIEPNLFLKATLPDAALCLLPRCGHLANLEEPALFNGIIFAFLSAVERGSWQAWKPRNPDSISSNGDTQ
jgi:pimeloyl-ACP methyl ester carboxylesterase